MDGLCGSARDSSEARGAPGGCLKGGIFSEALNLKGQESNLQAPFTSNHSPRARDAIICILRYGSELKLSAKRRADQRQKGSVGPKMKQDVWDEGAELQSLQAGPTWEQNVDVGQAELQLVCSGQEMEQKIFTGQAEKQLSRSGQAMEQDVCVEEAKAAQMLCTGQMVTQKAWVGEMQTHSFCSGRGMDQQFNGGKDEFETLGDRQELEKIVRTRADQDNRATHGR